MVFFIKKKEKYYKYNILFAFLNLRFPFIHKKEQVIQNRYSLFQLKFTFNTELQYVIMVMRKCCIMLALFIVVLLIAAQLMEMEEDLNENLTVVVEIQKP